MLSLLIIAKESQTALELRSRFIENGFTCLVATNIKEAMEHIVKQTPDLVLAEIDRPSKIDELCQKIKQEKGVPIIALLPPELLNSFNSNLGKADDFVIKPYDLHELELRVKRLLQGKTNSASSELIKCGDLSLDLASCEVLLSGKPVMLTFKEYELVKFLASNPGRVFTREALLNKVWGYDYFGGDRTVDVHIRRLRSKIEDASHTFIETVRNVGYRFKSDA